jgi:hypothetical protein
MDSRTGSIALNEAPKRIVQMNSFAQLLPSVDIVPYFSAAFVLRGDRDPAVWTHDCFDRHLFVLCSDSQKITRYIRGRSNLPIPTSGET